MMTEAEECVFREWITELSMEPAEAQGDPPLFWPCIDSKDPNRPQAHKPELPYMTALWMGMNQIGIPFPAVNERRMAVNAISLYSVQFYGDKKHNALRKAVDLGIVIRGPEAGRRLGWLAEQNRVEFGGPTGRDIRPFYIHNCGEAHQVSSIVNGVWEERARIDMEIQHLVITSQPVDYLSRVEVTIEEPVDITVVIEE